MFKNYIKLFLLIFALTFPFSHVLKAADERKSPSLPTVLWSKVFGFLAPYEFLANTRLVCSEWQKTRANWRTCTLPYEPNIENYQLRCFLEAACQLRSLEIPWAMMLSDEAFLQLGRQPHLRNLTLSYCSELTDAGIEFEHVEKVELASCAKIEGLTLLRLQNLQSIMLKYCNSFTDAGLTALSACPQLETLILENCPKVGNEGLRSLSTCRQLKQLELTRCVSITDAGLTHLQALKCLQKLYIARLPITDAGLAQITSLLLKLETFGLIECLKVGDEGLRSLSMCHQLQRLRLSYLLSITDAGLLHLRALKCLQNLCIENLSHITDVGIASLPADNLKLLSIAFLRRISGTTLNKFVNLESLNLHYVDLSEEGLRNLGQLTRLRFLELFADSVAPALESLRACPELQELQLQGIPVTDEGLKLLEALEGLQALRLSYCPNITEHALETLVGVLNNLERLEIIQCDKIDAKRFNRNKRR